MTADIQQINNLPFGRAYKITRGNQSQFMPSVTTVLKLNPDPFLETLERELGPEKYEQVRRRGGERGTVMHRWLEVFLQKYQESKNPETSLLHVQQYMSTTTEFSSMVEVDRAIKIGKSLFYNFYNARFYDNIKNVLHNEVFLYTFFRGGWAGACDFIYEDTDGHVVIQDFKSASDLKDVEHIDNYKMQISCYMFKFAELYGTLPERGEIVIANQSTMDLQYVYVPKEEMKTHLRRYLELLAQFRSLPEWVEFEEYATKNDVSGIYR